MPTTEHCRWWSISGDGFGPRPLFTDRATLDGLLTDSSISGLVATPILKPVLPDVACGKNDSKLGDKETHHGKQTRNWPRFWRWSKESPATGNSQTRLETLWHTSQKRPRPLTSF
jgi:hypothetical protein